MIILCRTLIPKKVGFTGSEIKLNIFSSSSIVVICPLNQQSDSCRKVVLYKSASEAFPVAADRTGDLFYIIYKSGRSCAFLFEFRLNPDLISTLAGSIMPVLNQL
jgi:virulence-associated protein VagC